MATYYISPAGNDTTGNGTSGTPWLTFAKFLSSSATGDTCICASGTYTWATATVTSRTVQAAAGAVVNFDGGGAALRWTLAGTCVFTGINFKNANNTGLNQQFFRTANSVSLTIRACTFSNLIVRNAGFNSQQGGIIASGNSGGAAYSVYVYESLFDNIVTDGPTNGSLFGEATPTGAAFEVRNTVFSLRTAANAIDAVWLSVAAGATGIIKNCIFANETGTTINLASLFFTTTTASYSDFYNITSPPSGTGNITSNPLFVDAASGNFNLRPTSPCINTGTLI